MSETNDAKPTSLSHIIGQSSVVAQVKVAIEAAFADRKRMDSALLVGAPGLGKSALASVVADELATEFHEVLGQSLNSVADLNALLLGAKDKDVIHIDECHELRKDYQTALYLAIDKRMLYANSGKSGRSPQGIRIADFTLLLSTTDEYCLLQPLRDRMRLTLRFEFYSVEDLATIVRHRCRATGWGLDEELLTLIAVRSRGTPRIALRLLGSCRRVCRSEGESHINRKHLDTACHLEKLDELGLGPNEQAYLQMLKAGPTRLNVIASRLSLPTRTVSQVTEAFLIRRDLIEKDKNGLRQLTPKGHQHLAESCPTIV